MARKLFMHLGPPKTGTSAVQHALRSYESTSLLYPQVGLWRDGSHHGLIYNFFGDFGRPEVERADISSMLAAICTQAAADPSKNLLISSEILLNYDVGVFADALLSGLGHADWQPEILFVCRDHFEVASSLYNQRVKDSVFLERRTPDQFLEDHLFSLQYAPLIRRMRNIGIPLTILNYHPAEDFLFRFLSYVGFGPMQGVVNQKRNVSLSVKGLIGTLAANVVAETIADRDRYFEAIRRMRPFFEPSRFIFGVGIVEAAFQHFSEDRLFLVEECNLALPPPFSEIPESKFSIEEEELGEIAAVTSGLGEAGRAIIAVCSRYVRSAS
jgi:hypothetical protein